MRGGSKKRVLPAAADFMRISTTPTILAGPVWISYLYGRILVSGALLFQGKSSLELLTAILVLLLCIMVSHRIKWPPLISIFLVIQNK